MRLPGLTLLLLFAALSAHAQTYKWVDAKGEVQYSDQLPPPGIKFEKIGATPPPAAPTAPAAVPKSLLESDLEFRKRQVEAQEKQQAEEQKAKAMKETCEAAQQRLGILKIGGRLMKSNADGEREYMSDDEIAAETVKAQKTVDETCK